MKLQKLFTAICMLAGAYAMPAHAAWPEKPITIVVPFPAGGNTDTIARITAQRLSDELKQPVVVENRPGAGGGLAATYVARSTPDGYTLFMATAPQLAILPHIQKVPYDPVKSFAPVTIVATNAFALAVSPKYPGNSLNDLIKDAKTRPGALTYASAGNGSVSHLSVALMAAAADVNLSHVPYKGGAPAIGDVIGGHVPMYFGNLAEVIKHHEGGKVKLLAVSSAKRSAHLPGVPTVAEQIGKEFETLTWNGIAAPAGTPQAVITTLYNAMKDAPKDKEFTAKLEAIGVDPLCNTPEQFAKILRADLVTWGEAVKVSGAKID
jgi:tripartite-type tricarboxylate transporter receptor subunit TctC